jgi:hypothetical protein
MAEKEKKNVYQKLMQARIDFGKKSIEPSGYNAHLNFDYLELKDIIPVANKVMNDNGITLITKFIGGECFGYVVDLDNTDDRIEFSIPHYHCTDPNRLKVNSEIQLLGMEVTYLRRYMYLLVLDIVMTDEIDADGEETPVVKPAVKSTPKKSEPKTEKKEEKPAVKGKVVVSSEKKSPATPEKRAEIKKELTDANGQATDLQVQTLKAIMMRWVNTCPADKEKATELLVKTNGFATCTKKEAEELIDMINGKIAEGEGAKK